MDLLYRNPLTIILADDDDDDRSVFREALKEVFPEARLLEVSNGVQLMERLASIQEKPDVIFLDINMPLKNGKECLVKIRQMDEFNDMPLIMYSTSVDIADIEWTFKRGANLYISKPVFYTGVVDSLRKVFVPKWKENLQDPVFTNYYLNAVSLMDFT